MADDRKASQTDSIASTTNSSKSDSKSFIKRELNGATFLTLEHVGNMLLVVVVSAIVVSGITLALNLWTQTPTTDDSIGSSMFGMVFSQLQSMWAVYLVSALLVLVPLMICLDRRVRSEIAKRPDYTRRLAYKAPVYTALGVLAAAIISAKITMLSTIIMSLVLIGTGADIGALYLGQFLPAAIAALIFAGAAWYLFKLAKGRDLGRTFNGLMAVLGVAIVVALLITVVTLSHNNKPAPAPERGTMYDMPKPSYDLDSNPYQYYNN